MHPHADAWAVASFAALASWVGIASQPAATSASGVEAVYESAPPEDSADQDQAAGQTGQSDSAAAADAANWMPLGVYALKRGASAQATSWLLQLSVNRTGAIAGSYYDVLSDTAHTVTGSIDKASHRVTWSIGSRESVSFETTVENLTLDEAPVRLRFRDGTTEDWSLVRLQHD